MKSRSTRVKAKATPKSQPRRKRGRPSAHTPALARAICERLASGEALLAICEAEGMPDRITVWRWHQQHPEFRNMILAAREFGADALAEQCLVIADGDGDERRDMIKIATRRWLASKIAPRRYGDRLATEISGAGGGPVEMRQMAPPTVPAEVGAAVRALITKAEADLGLPAGRGSLKGRMRGILDSGEPLPPDLYAAIYGGKGPNG